MTKFQMLREAIRTLRKGEFIGDAAALKSAMVQSPENPAYVESTRRLNAYNLKPLSTAVLMSLPAGTFGREYGEFLTRNRLTPFNFSGNYQDLLDRNPVMTRYIRIHDMVHTVLGFDTSLAGELGVYAFIYEQKYNQNLNRAYHLGRFGYRLLKPFGWKALSAAERRGKQLANEAKPLIVEPLEDYFSQPLEQVQLSLLGVPAQ